MSTRPAAGPEVPRRNPPGVLFSCDEVSGRAAGSFLSPQPARCCAARGADGLGGTLFLAEEGLSPQPAR